ncbi:PIG-L family deacetylase [Candidatus Woesearchaeota archaeon]|nr:PIG-L family deacetylase [Candidatus Woesearchaeota archaeon]MBW3021494.1 PIG-L family deacetylase [Candidatus Woesearchaeota archaeon]
MKVLVISAHPDDETLGAAGTILKHIENGDQVYWCTFTYAFRDAPQEYLDHRLKIINQVSKTYGFSETFNLKFPTVELDTVSLKQMVDKLSAVINSIRPEIIYTPTDADVNTDHEIVHKVVMVCCKPFAAPFVKQILGYEVISSTNTSFPEKQKRYIPNLFVDISDYIDKKIEIMKLFDEEFKQFPHPRSVEGIRALAAYRGTSSNLIAAEAFMLLRMIK